MRGGENWTLDSGVDSLVLWWREAGLHTLTADEPFDWFAAQTPSRAADRPSPAAAIAATPARSAAPAASGQTTSFTAARFTAAPDDLPTFLEWLAQDPTQPEAHWGGPALLPPALVDASLMVVGEIPDETGETLLDSPARALLDAMLSALGMRVDDATLASLATRRPAGGLIVEEQLAPLGDRFRHYLGLSRPRALLILGDRTARALGVTSDGTAGHGLQSVKTMTGTIAAAAIPNPALLMRRPRAKAESWKMVRHLSGVLR